MTSDNSLNINNNFQYPNLPESLIFPEDPKELAWFMNRLYEQMAFAINSKDNGIFTMAISNNFTLIPNMNSFGSYIVNISGNGPFIDNAGNFNYWPAVVFQCMKSTPNEIGLATLTQIQDGTGPVLGLGGTAVPPPAAYLITSLQVPSVPPNDPTTTPFYFFIRHNVPGVTGSFNVNIQGTQ